MSPPKGFWFIRYVNGTRFHYFTFGALRKRLIYMTKCRTIPQAGGVQGCTSPLERWPSRSMLVKVLTGTHNEMSSSSWKPNSPSQMSSTRMTTLSASELASRTLQTVTGSKR